MKPDPAARPVDLDLAPLLILVDFVVAEPYLESLGDGDGTGTAVVRVLPFLRVSE